MIYFYINNTARPNVTHRSIYDICITFLISGWFVCLFVFVGCCCCCFVVVVVVFLLFWVCLFFVFLFFVFVNWTNKQTHSDKPNSTPVLDSIFVVSLNANSTALTCVKMFKNYNIFTVLLRCDMHMLWFIVFSSGANATADSCYYYLGSVLIRLIHLDAAGVCN